MSDAAEYRLNAQVCADLAAATYSGLDRQIWLRLRQVWLKFAADAERREGSAAAQ